MLSHSQQADFHCPFCERKYKRKWDLSRHMKKAHQSRSEEDNRFEFDVRVLCSDRFASILEQNLQQAEMINYLLERNKQLQEQLDGNVVRI